MISTPSFRRHALLRTFNLSTLFGFIRTIFLKVVFRRTVSALALVLLAPFMVALNAELIPADRLTDWTPGVKVGVPGGIPTNRTRIIDVTKPPYNADNTGKSDCAAAFAAALAASKENDVIYFPAGTFRFDGGFGTSGHVHNRTIRGAGMDVTFIDSRQASGPAINIGSGSQYNYPTVGNIVTAGLTKGSTELTIGSTAEFEIGQLIQIEFENQTDDTLIKQGVVPVVSVAGFPYMRRQITRIYGKTANKLTIFPGIYHTPVHGLSARVTQSYRYTVGMGLEDFTLLNANNSAFIGIWFLDCFGSWIKNVKSKNASNFHVYFSKCLQSEIRGCHLDGRKTGGSNGAGIIFDGGSGNLVEDNIVEKVFPLIEVNHGASGNVFAYNLFDGSGMNINHGPHNSHNLYEGNISPWVQSDGYYGSASEDTIFRNWLTGTYHDNSTYTFIVSLNRFARNYSIVGNIVGTAGWPYGDNPYSCGNPNMGNSYYEGSHNMSAGIFPKDWRMTGVLIKRTSDFSGEVKLNSGSLRAGQIRAFMNGHLLEVSNVAGNVVTFKITGALPAEGSLVSIHAGEQGYQDQDLDVEATTLLKANYHMFRDGSGRVGIPSSQRLDAPPLPASLFRLSKPSYFAADQPWPPFDPLSSNPTPSYTSIPAGRRFVNRTVPPPTNGGGGETPVLQKPSNVRIMRQ